jgi:fructose-1,6-bisphosphatase II
VTTIGQPDRNLSLDLVRVTEAAALSAGRWMGLGNARAGYRSALEAMQVMLASVPMNGRIVIGDQRADPEDRLGAETLVGSGDGPDVDVVIDPVDGSRLVAYGRSNAVSAVAVADAGAMFDPGPAVYVEKIAVGPAAASAIDITATVERNLRAIARASRKDVDDLTIVVLDRPRHNELVEQIRGVGARIRLLTDGDVAGAVMPAVESTGVDALFGIGGAAEGVLAACALLCLGGAIQVRMHPMSQAEEEAIAAAGLDSGRVLTTTDLVSGDNAFFAATGVTDGELLQGVQYLGDGARTFSVTMRSRSGTTRMVEARHHWDKLMHISQVAYNFRGG